MSHESSKLAALRQAVRHLSPPEILICDCPPGCLRCRQCADFCAENSAGADPAAGARLFEEWLASPLVRQTSVVLAMQVIVFGGAWPSTPPIRLASARRGGARCAPCASCLVVVAPAERDGYLAAVARAARLVGAAVAGRSETRPLHGAMAWDTLGFPADFTRFALLADGRFAAFAGALPPADLRDLAEKAVDAAQRDKEPRKAAELIVEAAGDAPGFAEALSASCAAQAALDEMLGLG